MPQKKLLHRTATNRNWTTRNCKLKKVKNATNFSAQQEIKNCPDSMTVDASCCSGMVTLAGGWQQVGLALVNFNVGFLIVLKFHCS